MLWHRGFFHAHPSPNGGRHITAECLATAKMHNATKNYILYKERLIKCLVNAVDVTNVMPQFITLIQMICIVMIVIWKNKKKKNVIAMKTKQ
jgi:hypothetical protein